MSNKHRLYFHTNALGINLGQSQSNYSKHSTKINGSFSHQAIKVIALAEKSTVTAAESTAHTAAFAGLQQNCANEGYANDNFKNYQDSFNHRAYLLTFLYHSILP